MENSVSLIDNGVVTDIVLGSAKSKADKDYKFVSILFNNGYEQRFYLDRAVLFMVETLSQQDSK